MPFLHCIGFMRRVFSLELLQEFVSMAIRDVFTSGLSYICARHYPLMSSLKLYQQGGMKFYFIRANQIDLDGNRIVRRPGIG